MVDTFYDIVYDSLDKSVPKFSAHETKYPCWYSSGIKNLILIKTKHYIKFKNRSGDVQYHQPMYCYYRKEF